MFELLYDPEKSGLPMRVACFMSLTGTNARKVIEHQHYLESEGRRLYEVVVLFSDVTTSKILEIQKDYNIPAVVRDINAFYEQRGLKRSYFVTNRALDAGTREEFDAGTVEALRPYNVDFVALCGYMSACSNPLLVEWPAVNVHPADLSITENGGRKYRGAHAVRNQILAGEKVLRSTVHRVREDVDEGEIFMISKPLRVELPEGITLAELRTYERKELLQTIADDHQSRLKKVGDWETLPKTIEMIAEGRYGNDEQRNVYVDGILMLNGFRL